MDDRRTYQLVGRVGLIPTGTARHEPVQQLLAYRTRYGDIDAPPRTLFEMHNEDATPGPTLKAEDFIEAGRKILASMQPDAPPKSPQPVAGGCEWLGDCGPPWSTDLAKHHATLAALQRAQDDIAALRAEVERRDEIIACEKSLRENASAMANCRGATHSTPPRPKPPATAPRSWSASPTGVARRTCCGRSRGRS